MKHLVVGASGQVGGALLGELTRRGHEVVGTYASRSAPGLRPLDMRDSVAASELVSLVSPDVVWIPAAMPDVDRCEGEPDLSHQVNVEGPAVLLAEAAARRIALVYFSSDYVFDGVDGPYAENAVPHPLQTYGRHKAEAERMLLQYERTLVVRPAWIYSDEPNPRNFVYRVATDLRDGKILRAAVDQFNTPTPSRPLVSHALDAVMEGFQGVLHLAGPERMSRMELVQRIARIVGRADAVIEPVRLDELTLAAKRPANGGLITDEARFAIRERLEDADFRQILTRP